LLLAAGWDGLLAVLRLLNALNVKGKLQPKPLEVFLRYTTTRYLSVYADSEQSIVASLLLHWHYDGYMRWLRGDYNLAYFHQMVAYLITALRVQYTQRRDHFIDALVDEFDLRIVRGSDDYSSGCDVFNAYSKPAKGLFSEKSSVSEKSLFSFVPPTSGMFVWVSHSALLLVPMIT
jgi:hypothetical protein